jgi:hypothetical protein
MTSIEHPATLAPGDAHAQEVRSIVRAAATLLPRLCAVVERCRTEDDPGCDLARACGELSSAYHRLLERTLALPTTELTERIDLLLRHELRIVREAGLLAFRPHGPRWRHLAQSFGDGQTESSDELLRLAARL